MPPAVPVDADLSSAERRLQVAAILARGVLRHLRLAVLKSIELIGQSSIPRGAFYPLGRGAAAACVL